MNEAKLKTDVGGFGMIALFGILLWAFVFRDKAKKNTNNNTPPGNGNNGAAQPLEIRGLAVSTEARSPLMVTRVTFEYRGSASELVFGIAGKPDGAIFGVDFNNGQNVVNPYWFFSHFSVPDAPDWTSYAVGVDYELQEPVAGLYTARGGSTKEFIQGMADVWVWITSKTEILAAGLQPYIDEMMDERFIKVIDTDAGVLPVSSAVPELLEVQRLTVNYL